MAVLRLDQQDSPSPHGWRVARCSCGPIPWIFAPEVGPALLTLARPVELANGRSLSVPSPGGNGRLSSGSWASALLPCRANQPLGSCLPVLDLYCAGRQAIDRGRSGHVGASARGDYRYAADYTPRYARTESATASSARTYALASRAGQRHEPGRT